LYGCHVRVLEGLVSWWLIVSVRINAAGIKCMFKLLSGAFSLRPKGKKDVAARVSLRPKLRRLATDVETGSFGKTPAQQLEL